MEMQRSVNFNICIDLEIRNWIRQRCVVSGFLSNIVLWKLFLITISELKLVKLLTTRKLRLS
jgi:hypothetical protein